MFKQTYKIGASFHSSSMLVLPGLVLALVFHSPGHWTRGSSSSPCDSGSQSTRRAARSAAAAARLAHCCSCRWGSSSAASAPLTLGCHAPGWGKVQTLIYMYTCVACHALEWHVTLSYTVVACHTLMCLCGMSHYRTCV